MATYAADRLYSNEHEWVAVEGEIAAIGITDFAQAELGDVVFVELPEVGETFNAGDEIGTIESVKAVAEIYTPVSGEVVEVNRELENKPELVNEDAHGAGWLINVRMSAVDELTSLMSSEAYQELVEAEEA